MSLIIPWKDPEKDKYPENITLFNNDWLNTDFESLVQVLNVFKMIVHKHITKLLYVYFCQVLIYSSRAYQSLILDQ